MKKSLFGFAVLVLALGTAFAATAADTTLKGEPVDMQCYLTGQSGEGHASCAKSCAEKGTPIGFMSTTADGKKQLYLVLGADRKPAKDFMAEHMGKQVTVTGTVTEKNGMKVITVSKVEST